MKRFFLFSFLALMANSLCAQQIIDLPHVIKFRDYDTTTVALDSVIEPTRIPDTTLLDVPVDSVQAQDTISGMKRMLPQESLENQLRLYPNPTQHASTLKLTLNESQPLAIYLFDAAGRLMRQILPLTHFDVGTIDQEIPLNGLPPGVYYMKIFGTTFRDSVRVVKLSA